MLRKLIRHSFLAYKRSPFYGEKLMEDFLKGLLLFWAMASTWSSLFQFNLWVKENYQASQPESILLFLLLFPWTDLLLRFFLQSSPQLNLVPYLALNIKRKTITKSVYLRSFLSPWFVILLLIYLVVYFVLTTRDFSALTKFNIGLFMLGVLLLNNILNFWVKLEKRLQNIIIALYCILSLLFTFQYFGWIEIVPYLLKFSSSFFHSTLLASIPVLLFVGLSVLFLNELPKKLTSFTDDSVSTKSLPFQFFSKYGEIGKQVDYEILMALRLKTPRGVLLFSLFWIFYPLLLGMRVGENTVMSLLMGMFTSFGMVQYGNSAFSWHTYHFSALEANKNSNTVLWGKYYFLILLGFLYSLLSTLFYAFNHKWFLPYIWLGFYFNIGFSIFLSFYYSIKFLKPKNPYKQSAFNTSKSEFNVETIVLSFLFFIALIIPYAIGSIIWNKYIGLFCVTLFCLALFLLRKRMMAYVERLYEKNRYKMYEKFKLFTE